jgi:predicted ATPase
MAPQDSALLAVAHCILGLVRFSTGQFPAARELFERAEVFDAGLSRNVSASFIAFAPGVASTMLVSVLVILGYPMTALGRANALLETARRSSDPVSTNNAFIADSMRHLLLRETRMVAARADEMLSIATEHENNFIFNLAIFFRGWATALAGRAAEGISEMQRSIAELPQAVAAALLLVALAETCGNNGRAEQGLHLLDQRLATADQTSETVSEAELHRVKGELLMIKEPGNMAEAERSLLTAIDVARKQSAKLFELRATVSLARLIANQNRRDEARAMLTDIYNWFTEGFDTPDLKDAKSLLQELSG